MSPKYAAKFDFFRHYNNWVVNALALIKMAIPISESKAGVTEVFLSETKHY